MNEYLAISDSVKQSIAETYSKQNPSVDPQSAREKSNRGALVFDTIDHLFQEHQNGSSADGLPLHLLSVDEDLRFSDSRNSHKSSRRMAEFLSQRKDSGFNVLDKSGLFQLLTKREQALAECGYDARNAKIELVRMMDTLESALTQVKTQVEKYMRNTHKQLEIQSSILQKETELGDLTVPQIESQFKKLFTQAKDKPNSLKDVADMFGILQQKEKVTRKDIAELNGKMLQHSLKAFQDHIEKRKTQIQEIQQMLPVLDKVICAFTGEKPAQASTSKNANGGSNQRMSKFLNKFKRFFGS